MNADPSIGFIGGGQMCEAIFSGVLAGGGAKAGDIHVTDVNEGRLAALAEQYGIHTYLNDDAGTGALAVAAQCDVLILAIKPQFAAAVLEKLAAGVAADTLVISIMAGVTLQTLAGYLPQNPMLRVMPNTPMLVRKGVAGIAQNPRATPQHRAFAEGFFGLLGAVYFLPEKLIDPLSALSGCGPAYAYLFIEALADGGVEQGLPRDVAQALAAQTLAGAAEMVLQSGRHPGALKDSVCSPGGSTIAGVHALEDGAFRATVMDAVERAFRRTVELGQGG